MSQLNSRLLLESKVKKIIKVVGQVKKIILMIKGLFYL